MRGDEPQPFNEATRAHALLHSAALPSHDLLGMPSLTPHTPCLLPISMHAHTKTRPPPLLRTAPPPHPHPPLPQLASALLVKHGLQVGAVDLVCGVRVCKVTRGRGVPRERARVG